MTRGFHLTQPIARSARLHPDGMATIDGEGTRTHAELLNRVRRIAGGLADLGVTAGDRLSALALNSDRYLEYLHATWWLGAVAAPVNIRWSTEEIAQALNDVASSVLLVDRAHADRVDAILAACPTVRTVVALDDVEVPGGLSLDDLAGHDTPAPDAGAGGSDPACILFTGGTTGSPKGAVLSHDAVVAGGVGMRAMGCGTTDRLLHSAPLFHMGGIQMLSAHLFGGGTHVLVPGFVPATVLHAIEDHRVTDLMLAPTMLAMLLDHPELGSVDLGSLRQIVYGTAPISQSLLGRAMAAVPDVTFVQGYGMTETTMTLMLPAEVHRPGSPLQNKLGSTGLPAPFTEVRIVGPDGEDLPRGAVGELAVRTPGLMTGYWNRPEETARTIRDGWLHSGDGAFIDDDGYVHVVDRIKDMIITGGENVFSVEVEGVIARHPAVAAVAVIGLPDPVWGETVHAVVVPVPGSAPDAQDIIAFARASLAGFKAPRSVEFVEALPLSAANKVLKKVLRDERVPQPAE